jgi:hypothetical protein
METLHQHLLTRHVDFAVHKAVVDELNRVALSVEKGRVPEQPTVMGFLWGIYERYVGAAVVPRDVEGWLHHFLWHY